LLLLFSPCCCLPRCSHLARCRLDLDESLPLAYLLPCWLGLAVAAAGQRGREALGAGMASMADASDSEPLRPGPCPMGDDVVPRVRAPAVGSPTAGASGRLVVLASHEEGRRRPNQGGDQMGDGASGGATPRSRRKGRQRDSRATRRRASGERLQVKCFLGCCTGPKIT
jgi:hypothetical protein